MAIKRLSQAPFRWIGFWEAIKTGLPYGWCIWSGQSWLSIDDLEMKRKEKREMVSGLEKTRKSNDADDVFVFWNKADITRPSAQVMIEDCWYEVTGDDACLGSEHLETAVRAKHLALSDRKKILSRTRSSTENSSRYIPGHIRYAVWLRDAGRCNQCASQEALEFDHIIPLSKGGANSVDNLQLLCLSCNRSKSNKIDG